MSVMMLQNILILIVSLSLPFNNILNGNTRIFSIILIYAGVLLYNGLCARALYYITLYVQSIGHGVGIFSGLFHVTSVSQWVDTFLFVIGSLIYKSLIVPNL